MRPVLPLRDVVVFPHVAMPLLVGRPGSLAAVAAASASDGELLLVAQRDADEDAPEAAGLHRVGVVARLQQVTRLPNGSTRILAEAVERVRIARFLPARAEAAPAPSAALRARITPFPLEDAGRPSDTNVAGQRRLLALFEEYTSRQRRLPAELVGVLEGLEDAVRVAWAIAAHLQIPAAEKQLLLAEDSLGTLQDRLADRLATELELLAVEQRIDDTVRGTMLRHQREAWLQEQMRAIHKELGQDDGDDVDELATRVGALGLPESVTARVQRELGRLRRLSPMSPEAGVSRAWLDWIIALPWHARADEAIDLGRVRDQLTRDHFGLEEVKERILDYVAVIARTGTRAGPVLCLVGPPGVGKTSLARSIAEALGRPFVRLSLGGVRDEAEIRGHRRTYVGALPGRLVQGMRRAGVVNPVLLLDELDKLGRDWRGDPASALLEVLDAEQHHAFSDHYLEVDYDLSQVLFVTTANSLSAIPDALRDRLEIVRLPGYLEPEKVAIAERHLWPRQRDAHGLSAHDVVLGEGVVHAVIRSWTREAGVRELDRRLARVARKVARRLSEGGDDVALPITVDAATLSTWLGVPPYERERIELEDRVGVANGLAWTPAGGELLQIEVAIVPGRGRLQLTGTLGDVMKESASAALTWVRANGASLGIDDAFLQRHDIHLHVPAGAQPKDGPSAGLPIAIAIASACTGRTVRGDIALTGEVTLRGRVLAVGGVREKGVAAHRDGIRRVLLPTANARDLDELPESVREALTWTSVATIGEAIELALAPATSTARKRPAKPVAGRSSRTRTREREDAPSGVPTGRPADRPAAPPRVIAPPPAS